MPCTNYLKALEFVLPPPASSAQKASNRAVRKVLTRGKRFAMAVWCLNTATIANFVRCFTEMTCRAGFENIHTVGDTK